MESLNNYSLITGASQGLGKALARECAKWGRNLILVSLPGENLKSIAYAIQTEFGIEAVSYEVDLTKDRELDNFLSEIIARYSIDMLINNAGTGGTARFNTASLKYIDNIIMLNMRALVVLTRKLLPILKRQPQAYILNIASMASFGPMPFKTIYPASKAFVYSFSRGLNAELKGSNVFVSVAHPGAMATNPEVIKRIKSHSRLVRSTLLSVDKIAEICIRQLFLKDSLIIPGFMNKVSYLFLKVCPVWLRLIIFRKSLIREIYPKKPVLYA